MSATRKRYFVRLIGRIVIFIGCLIMCFNTQNFEILKGKNFFKELHILHLLWLVWVCDMVL